MQKMTRRTALLVKLSVCAALCLGFVAELKAQEKKVDGTWTWTVQGRQGGAERKMTLKLKTDGEKLTGKLATPGRDGNVNETEIKDGKIKGDEISFTVVREIGGNTMTSKYTGKLAGDTIKGKYTFERNGEPQSRDWEAKRQAEKK